MGKKEKVARFYDFLHGEIRTYDNPNLLPGMLMEKFGVDGGFFRGMTCLDAGCGGGKNVYAMGLLGARRIAASDISSRSLSAAMMLNRENAWFQKASVLELPYRDCSFDVVFCEGVLHHTESPYAGFLELSRVAKRDGSIVLLVYSWGGAIFFLVKLLRPVFRLAGYRNVSKLLSLFMSRNRSFGFLDMLCVPIQRNYNPSVIRKWLESGGFTEIRFAKERGSLLQRVMNGEGVIKVVAMRPR